MTLKERVLKFESDVIRQTLIECWGSQRKAAEILGVKYSTLHGKIRRFGINPRCPAERREK